MKENTSPLYRVRYRFKLEKKLNISEGRAALCLDGREVILSSENPDKDIIKDSTWLVMNAHGFESKEQAESYAIKLKKASEAISASMKLGLNSGIDKLTSNFGQVVIDKAREEFGIILRGTTHGIDIFEDDPRIQIGNFTANLSIHASGQYFIDGLNHFFNDVGTLSQRTADILLLLNYALLTVDPVARIVFSISAVEMLGQDEKWSEDQKELIGTIPSFVLSHDLCSDDEREEIADSIRKGLHKLSLRQGVFRLLNKLGLDDLRKEWDSIYGERSTLVHGLAPKPGVDYRTLSNRTLNLCGHILLSSISDELPRVKEYIDRFYKINN